MNRPRGTRCCWPDCFTFTPLDLSTPMCWRHARIIAEDFMRAANLTRDAIEATKAKNRERTKLEGGDVYYIRIDGLIKIGYSQNVFTRMMAYPPTSELLAVEKGTKAVESLRHGQFRLSLEHGREWFRESPDLTQWIAQIREQYGDPSEKAYQFTRPGTSTQVTSKRRRSRRR